MTKRRAQGREDRISLASKAEAVDGMACGPEALGDNDRKAARPGDQADR
jgi:hypothetical protein